MVSVLLSLWIHLLNSSSFTNSSLSLSRLLMSWGFFRRGPGNWSSTYYSCLDMSSVDECLRKHSWAPRCLGQSVEDFTAWEHVDKPLVSCNIRWGPLFKLSCPSEACSLFCFLSDWPYFPFLSTNAREGEDRILSPAAQSFFSHCREVGKWSTINKKWGCPWYI